MYNRILVPLDGSEFSECALEHVREIASGCHASEVVLLAVAGDYTPGSGWSWGGVVSESHMVDEVKKAQRDAAKYLAGIAEKLCKEGLCAIACVEIGTPADVILTYVKKIGADLVIMATHGRSGPSRWALGSVAEKVIIASSVPVILVSPKGCRIV